ncbi:MAG: aspartyl/asparaginyl beta-hydroxylase domain-containing protein [Rhizobiaceae bacterium]|nr:aspartyl/asparaginyl beta-hydroxylase domain-containing protein [Rhizobiaceae bacterium]
MNSSKTIGMVVKIAFYALIAYFLPVLALVFLVFGIIDVARHKNINGALLKSYFLGNGVLTWLLTPFNLFTDLISSGRNPVMWRPEDFSGEHRKEIDDLLKAFDDNKETIISEIGKQMEGKKRGMVFFKWYDKPGDESIADFNREWKYIKTIGVSVFNAKEATRLHYGPVRVTVRLLYNLNPRKSDDIFLEVDGVKYHWHDDPLIIFDDTVNHRSINGEDWQRFVAFVDVLRPSRFTALQDALVGVVAAFQKVNGIFYTNWTQMKLKGKPAGGAA